MTLKTVKIKIRSWTKGLDDAIQTLKKIQAGKPVKPQKGVYFDNLKSARRLITPKRLELLRLIREFKPSSIKRLAEIAKRDFKMVYKDVFLLKKFGLVEMSTSKKGVPTRVKSNTQTIQFEVMVG